MTLFKKCSQNFDLSINMALVNRGFLHYMDMKKLLKKFFPKNRLSDFEIISQECSLGDPFQKLFAKFWSVYKYGSGEWGLFALYRHEEIHVCNCYRQAALTICEPTGQVKFLVCYCQFGSLLQIPVDFGLWDLKSKWILNCLQNPF